MHTKRHRTGVLGAEIALPEGLQAIERGGC